MSIKEYPISVSKVYRHRGKNIKHRRNTKKVWQVMYYMVDTYDGIWELRSKYVSRFTAWYYKLTKVRQTTLECDYCERPFKLLYRWNKPNSLECEDCKL